MKKVKTLFNRHYYALTIYFFILIYNFIVFYGFSAWNFHEVGYALHLVDFSMGFCTKFLPGAIFNFIFDTTDEKVIIAYEAILLLLFVFIISLFLEKLIVSVALKDRTSMLLMVMFFVTGSSTITLYIFMLGSLDSYWLFLSIIFIYLLEQKRLYFLIIPVSALLIIVHYATIIAFVPFFVLLMLYKISVLQDRKEKLYLGGVLISSVILMLFLSFYFIIYESGNLKYPVDEFIELMQTKNPDVDLVYLVSSLYEYDFFDTRDVELFEGTNSPLLHSIDLLIYRIQTTFAIRPLFQGVIPLIADIPIVLIILTAINKVIRKNSRNKLKRLALVLISAMFFITTFLSLFLSTDTGRFVGHAYMLLFASFLYIIYKERSYVLEYIYNCISKFPELLIRMYCLFYFFTITEPFT